MLGFLYGKMLGSKMDFTSGRPQSLTAMFNMGLSCNIINSVMVREGNKHTMHI
jgi:hypothetical protein